MDFSKYVKSDSIMRGENVLVLQNLDHEDTKKIIIELSSASSSSFDYTDDDLEIFDNLDLTAKIVQACLREYYVNCTNATQEASVMMGINTPFTITVEFVKYHFTNMADFLSRKNTLPFFLETEVLRFKDLCEEAIPESSLVLPVDHPFSITVKSSNGLESDTVKYDFLNIQDFLSNYLQVFDKEIQSTILVEEKEIPVKEFSILTSRPFPIINRDEVAIKSYQINEASKHLTLSPSMLESATVGYSALDAYLRQDGETVTISSRPTYDDPEAGESHNITFVNSTFQIFEPQIRSPLRHYTSPDSENVSSSYSVLSPMLRDNLIRGYDDISKATLSYKVLDVTILDIVQDFEQELDAFKTTHKVLDVSIREHATELPIDAEGINYNNFKALDATTRIQLIIANTPLEATKTTPLVTDATLRNHLLSTTSSIESFNTSYSVPDVIIRKDLHLAYVSENVNTINTIKDPVMIKSLHVNYDQLNELKTTVNVLDPDISGETIVPISCLGSTEQTQEITMNGNFTAYLNDVKLNQQPMSVSTLRTLLAAYGLEIEIISE